MNSPSKLPELPVRADWHDAFGVEVFTASQMRAYAEQAVRDALASAPADEREEFHKWCDRNEFDRRRRLDGTGYNYDATRRAWLAWQARAALASAPVAGEAQKCPKCNGSGSQDSGGVQPWGEPILIPCDCDAACQGRPSDDALWDQTLTERDEYHDMADKLANAIADHLLVEIGEHSSSNCPWMRALDAIENAVPQASAHPKENNHAEGADQEPT